MIRSFLVLLLVCNIAYGQTCTHTNLSRQYDFRVKHREETENDLLAITISVIDKKTKKETQKISYKGGSIFLFTAEYSNCNNVRSYSTGINKNKQVVDNGFGYLVIADLNFDNRDDLAVVTEEGSNAGPMYSFYIQDTNGKFVRNKYLTEHLRFFPRTINTKKKTLETTSHASSSSVRNNVYKVDSATNKWKMVSSEIEELE